MTAAALALALAVLLAPVNSRMRAKALLTSPARARRVPLAACAAAASAATALLLPLTAMLAVAVLTVTLLARRRRRRQGVARAEEATALQSALDILVAELRIGAHPVAAIGAAAQECGGQVGGSLNNIAARALLGADVVAGLRVAGRQSSSPKHWDRLAVCWELAQTHGLAIATLLQAAQRDITERERFRGRVEAGMAGARATAVILAGLPALGVLLGHAIGAAPVSFLLSGGAGSCFLLVGTVLICCGLLWSDRITAGVLA
jgi:tight adherence protein B